MPPGLRIYRAGTALLAPLAALLLERRAKRGKEDRARLGERQGVPGRPRPAGPLAWVHGASVGESLAALPIVERLVERGYRVLATSGTLTSARLLERRLPPGSLHQFAPLDVPAHVRRFLDHWRPDIALFVESEIWPNLVVEASTRGIPLVLVNARMSERSFRRWQRLPASIAAVLGRFALCLAQSPADADRLARLGAPRVEVTGNLKFDAAPPPADPLRVSALRGAIGDRPAWIAASTHEGEEDLALDVHASLVRRFQGLLTVIAPRHPNRGDEVADEAERRGLRVARRSAGQEPDAGCDVFLVDTIGELGLVYRVIPIVFMGGSLVPHGGQNPIEPGKLGAAILHGPHVHNFSDVYASLDRDGGALAVGDPDQLAAGVAALLDDGHRVRVMARAAGATVDHLGGAVDRTMAAIAPWLAAAGAVPR